MAHGLAKQIVSLLVQNVPPMLFLLAPQIAYSFGVTGILGFTAAGMLSFFLLRFAASRSNLLVAEQPQLRFAAKFLFLTQSICYLLMTGKMVLLRSYWNDSVWFLVALGGVITAGILLAGRRGHGRWIPVSVILMGMIASVLIPMLVYLNVSIPTVYSGVHFLAVDTLSLSKPEAWWLFPVFLLGMAVQQCLPFFLGDEAHPSAQTVPFLLGALLWSFLPVSLGSLAFVAKAQAIWPNQTDQVGILVMEQLAGQVGNMLFLVSVFAMLVYSAGSVVNKVKETEGGWKEFAGALLAAAVIAFWPDATVLDVFVGFCLAWGPLLSVVLAGRGQKADLIFMLCGALVAFVLSLRQGMVTGILCGTLISALLAGSTRFFRKSPGLGKG